DAQAPASHLLAIQALDCRCTRLRGGKLDEGETARAASLTVRPDAGFDDRSGRREELPQLVLRSGKAQITDKRRPRHKPSFPYDSWFRPLEFSRDRRALARAVAARQVRECEKMPCTRRAAARSRGIRRGMASRPPSCRNTGELLH